MILRLLVVILVVASFLAKAQSDEFTFTQLSTDLGLSNHQVNTITQDEHGFIWVGTLSGLNRFDGYEVTSYYHEPGNPNSLLSNAIIWMEQGPDQCLWINTGAGFTLYNTREERFKSAQRYLDTIGIPPAEITGLHVDSEGGSWFKTNRSGLVRLSGKTLKRDEVNTSDHGLFRIATDVVTDLANGPDGNTWIIHSNAMVEVIDVTMDKIVRKFDLKKYMDFSAQNFSIFLDTGSNLWVYSRESPFGLFYLNTTTGQSKLYDEKVLISNLVRSMIERPNGDIWVGVDHGGITILKKDSGDLIHLQTDSNNPNSLSSNNISSLFQDRDGIVWVGTNKNGISYFTERSGSFPRFNYKTTEPSFNDITSLVEDKNGELWIGSDGGGLLHLDRETNLLQPVRGKVKGTSSQPEVIVSMLMTSEQELWIGTYLEGLYKYSNNTFEKIPFPELTSISVSSVWELFEDSNHGIWIGTLSNGVFHLDKEGTVTRYSQESGLYSNYITCTTEDAKGHIWVGCGTGISVIDPRTKSIRNYHEADPGPTISNNSVTALLRASDDKIWIGTMSGLNIYDPKTETFKVYYKKDGLASDIAMAILEDNQGNKWVSSNQGITKLETINDSTYFKTYETLDGLQGEIFNEGAALKTHDGKLLFAGQNGFNMFDPSKVEYDHKPPKLVFTDFFISNTRINSGEEYDERVILPLGLNSAEEIVLSHDENSFAIGFTSPTYFQPTKIKYQYMLEGFDKGWVNLQSETKRVNYTNLDFGNYTFRVRASNNHQVWSEDNIALKVRILPPFWETPWAYILYTVGLFIMLYFVRRAIIQRERRKAKIRHDKLEEQRLHELDLMKIKFFTNISHEFRTPISLIMTPVERMIDDPSTAKVTDYKMVHRNAKRLLNLVNQLLDFRKMEVNQHVLSESSGDLVRFMQDIVDSFTDISREREVELRFETDLKAYLTRFDRDKMEKIFFNLLSNAFKFTLPGGSIIVSMEHSKRDRADDWISIYVSDTGIGIPQDKQEAIFNRFFQTQIPSNIINNGSGIGLAITKEFVELHKGHVAVESQENIGSTFIVELPLRDVSKDQMLHEEPEEKELESKAIEVDPEKPTVFLVEDNADFRFYLRDNMKQWYNVLEAANGKEGWKGILKVIPDIVISDVMMPVMDGLELCRKIKNDPRTAQIPVILLTAQSSDHHRIEGLDAGAIEYISKPFNFEILISNIKSALKFQNRIIEANKKVVVTPSEVSIVSMDEQLIIKATKLVEENISNSEFSVEDMSHELGYSRGHLYQKMLKITGQTPMDFIRNIRMSRAEELLKRSQLNVSEIAYKVGYNNPKLFSRYFKYHFNKYPSEFLSEARKAALKSDVVDHT